MEIINLFWLILQCRFHSLRRNPVRLLIILFGKEYLKMNGELRTSIHTTTLRIYLQSHFLVVRSERSSLRCYYIILHNIEVETTALRCLNFRWILCLIWVIFPKYVTFWRWVYYFPIRYIFTFYKSISINCDRFEGSDGNRASLRTMSVEFQSCEPTDIRIFY